MRHNRSLLLAVGVLLGSVSAANAAFTITLNFSGSPSAAQMAAFTNAKATWESIITGYKAGVNLSGITINAAFQNIDGPGGVLGAAGPTGGFTIAGTSYATTGDMTFDSSDYGTNPPASFTSVVLHEMAHVIGFGTLWTANNLYVNNSGQYTGANALAAWKTEFNKPSATFVPVELGGGSGTANGHWNENDGGGSNTGIVDASNRDFRLELMTGWLDTPAFISQTTKAQFVDLGYTIAVPEPTGLALAGLASVSLMVRRRR